MSSGEEHNARHGVRPKQSVVAASCISPEGALMEAAPSKRGIIVKKAPNEGRVLDGFLLLDTCKGIMVLFSNLSCSNIYMARSAVEFPEEVNEVVLVGLRINQILGEDLFFFNNLIRMDISDNEVLYFTARSICLTEITSFLRQGIVGTSAASARTGRVEFSVQCSATIVACTRRIRKARGMMYSHLSEASD